MTDLDLRARVTELEQALQESRTHVATLEAELLESISLASMRSGCASTLRAELGRMLTLNPAYWPGILRDAVRNYDSALVAAEERTETDGE